MKNIALFGKAFSEEHAQYVNMLVQKLSENQYNLSVYKPYYEKIRSFISFDKIPELFTKHQEIVNKADYLFSIGGDGTLLDTITLVRNSGIPVLGINLGRMGFLSSISKEKIGVAIEQVIQKKYTLEERTLIRLETGRKLFDGLNYALNEITVYRKNPFSILTIQAYINGEFLNPYCTCRQFQEQALSAQNDTPGSDLRHSRSLLRIYLLQAFGHSRKKNLLII